jgi:ribosomal protein S18 acetylase RimI-like enzyme
MKPIIRPMDASDKLALMAIIKQIPEFEPDEVPIAEEVIDCYLKSPENSGYYILIAEHDLSLAGYVGYGNTPLTKGTWDIYWIGVEPGKQGRGIGKALIEAAESDIKKRGGRLILLETSSKPAYKKTRAFYTARGYTQIATIADFYSLGDDLVIFEKRIS